MRIATWNVNGVRARTTRLLEWLAERRPNIVCLQELKATDEDFPALELRAAGYHAVIAAQQGWNGVGVLAREPLEVLERELPGAPSGSGARFLVARTGGLTVASAYVPNGKDVRHADFPLKLAWLDRLAEAVEARSDEGAAFVLGGDFNVCATDLDSYLGAGARGTIFHTDAERDRIARLERGGLRDLYRARYPAEPGFTYWDYRAGAFHKKLGMRLDLLFASPSVERRVSDVTVDREYRKKSPTSQALPSDHAPVFVDLVDG